MGRADSTMKTGIQIVFWDTWYSKKNSSTEISI